MDKVRRDYPDIAPAGPTYSRAVRSGNMLFISGCTARGTEAQGKPLMEQLRVTLDRISRIVAAEGGSARDIVKIAHVELLSTPLPMKIPLHRLAVEVRKLLVLRARVKI